jgi:site-specific DNA-cytosine methylase
MLRVLDLFSGIGGFSLGLERTGGLAPSPLNSFKSRVLVTSKPTRCSKRGSRMTRDYLTVEVMT